MTLLCAVITLEPADAGFARALTSAESARRAGADVIELRADALLAPDADEDDAREAAARLAPVIAQAPAPLIATCRPTWEGGACEAAEPARFALLAGFARATTPPAYIDIELAALEKHPSWRALIGELAQAADDAGQGQPRTRALLSMHDFAGRPADLLRRVRAMRESPAAALKIVCRARSVRDNLELFDLLRERDRPTIALAMGEAGVLSRILAPKFNGFAVYAPAPDQPASAPGQLSLRDLLETYRFRAVGASTRVFGVIGEPVAHSLSPLVHNAGFAAVEFDGVYAPLPVAPSWEAFKATAAALIAQDGLDFSGASVTIPHKEHALRFALDMRQAGQPWEVDEWAQRAGACNTLALRADGVWLAANTDAPAIAACVRASAGREDLSGMRAIVLGAGGSARAAAAALLHANARVCVAARRVEQARALIDAVQEGASVGGAGSLESAAWGAPLDDADLVINCTPIGMASGKQAGASPLNEAALASLGADAVVFDTVYNPLRTPLLKLALARGLRTIDGAQLFVRQAAMQFEKWTGAQPPTDLFERLVRGALRSGAPCGR